MVQLDHQLLYQARQIITGANVHRMKEMIFAYEQAVDLHNRAWPRHETYKIKSELQLRKYVLECQSEDLKRLRAAAVVQARQGSWASNRLADAFDEIEAKLTEWSQRHEKKRAA